MPKKSTPVTTQQLTLLDKRRVLNAIIDAVTRLDGFTMTIAPDGFLHLKHSISRPPDDPAPGWNTSPPPKKNGGWPKGKKRKPTGGAAHKKFVAKKAKP